MPLRPRVIAERSHDAEYILEAWELSLPWREVIVETSGADGWTPRLSLTAVRGYGTDDERRMREVADWVERDHRGDWAQAFHQSPVLVAVNVPTDCFLEPGQRGILLDGWHRREAARRVGVRVMTALLIDYANTDGPVC